MKRSKAPLRPVKPAAPALERQKDLALERAQVEQASSALDALIRQVEKVGEVEEVEPSDTQLKELAARLDDQGLILDGLAVKLQKHLTAGKGNAKAVIALASSTMQVIVAQRTRCRLARSRLKDIVEAVMEDYLLSILRRLDQHLADDTLTLAKKECKELADKITVYLQTIDHLGKKRSDTGPCPLQDTDISDAIMFKLLACPIRKAKVVFQGTKGMHPQERASQAAGNAACYSRDNRREAKSEIGDRMRWLMQACDRARARGNDECRSTVRLVARQLNSELDAVNNALDERPTWAELQQLAPWLKKPTGATALDAANAQEG